MTTTTPTAPIPCRVCPELVQPGQRALVLTAEVAYHRGCFRALSEPLTRRVLRQREWRTGRCRIGGAA
jgi:hypothetical protein